MSSHKKKSKINQELDGLITEEECQQYLAKYNLPKEQIADIKNSVIGIVNTIITGYLERFD
ncbi:MAG: hypothetical protein WC107_02885 [Patescibacteria group bacterium]